MKNILCIFIPYEPIPANIMNCKFCQKSFDTSHYAYEEICSRRCHDAHVKKLNSVTTICPICSNEFTYDKRKSRVVCSIACANKFQVTDAVLVKKKAKMQKSLMEKYGVTHNSQLPDFLAKSKDTRLKRYGNPNFTNKEKAKETLIARYGNAKYNNDAKRKSTMQTKYGVNGFSQSKLFKQRLKEKYGVEHPMHILKNKEAAFKRVVSKLTTLTPLFDFDGYLGTDHIFKYRFKCNICSSEFESGLDDGRIPICRICNPIDTSKSKCEYEIIEWIQQHYAGTILHSDRTFLNGKELDIFIPDLNLAIELDGLYYHGELVGSKNKKYHLNKTKWCAEKGVTLLHILDIEWIAKQDIVKSILLNKINSSKISNIHGRRCIIREIPASESNEFLNDNHIQGEDKASVRIGLYYKDELVSLITFGKNRFGSKPEWEMYRFCNKRGYNVRGSLEKLFKYFCSVYNPSSILTFADRRYFTGNAYSRLNFKLHSITPPNYHYFKINNQKTIFSSRNKFQKHKLSKLLDVYDPTLTEWENMQLNGYDRIWDCGNTRWLWDFDK